MIKNYLKVALRNLGKHKSDTAINLIGLCVAFTSGLLLFLSVYYEFSFDRFHKNANNIYHLYFNSYTANKTEISNSMPVPLLPTLKATFPEIAHGVRSINSNGIIRYKDKHIGQQLKLTDADFFEMFSFNLLKGNAETALKELNNVVLGEKSASAIFGNEEPLNKVLQIQINGEWKPFVVSAIAAEAPENSSIDYSVILRFENDVNYAKNVTEWDNQNHDVYLQLREGTTAAAFEKKLPAFINQHFAERIETLKRDGAKASKAGAFMDLSLQPFLQLHTDTTLRSEGRSISKNYLYLLLIIGFLILAIACINFINLSIGRSFTRSKEIGLRKTLGAERWQLTIQFWAEALLMCLLAFLVSGVLVYILLPHYKQLFAMNINRDILFSPAVLVLMLVAFLVVTILAGGYPAWVMSKLSIVEIVKGKLSVGQSQKLRNGLIVVQFSIAILLMICTLISWQQINYLKSKPLGYNRDQIISIPIEGDMDHEQVLKLMRNELTSYPNIEGMTGIYNNLGSGLDGSSRRSIVGFDYKNHEIKSAWMGVSYDFIKTLDLELKAGRDFSTQFSTDTNAIVINEQMAALLGEKDPIGLPLNIDENAPPKTVIGVVKDFHFESLHNPIQPLTLVIDPDFQINYILVKVKPANLAGSMELIKKKWKKILPTSEFKGSFTDENIDRQYRREEKLGEIFISGAIIAIILSCMGLLAMVILIVTQRKKEIGIRKVLGASVANIVTMVSSDFLKLVIVSAVIAFPVAWWAMNKWLETFSYRVPISGWMFILAAIAAIVIALLTISFQSIKAAIANPVKSLRSE
jgi:ABC-type antimicrobial peptide transport system permease subunit